MYSCRVKEITCNVAIMKHIPYTCIYIFKNQCYIILTFIVYAFHNYYRVMTACPKIYTKSLKMLIYNENILEKYKVW